MNKIILTLTMLVSFNTLACNLTQEQKDEKASNGMWEEVTNADYSFPPVVTDWMTANGLWGTNDDN